MAEQPPGFQFDEVPIDDARRMGRGPRIAPELYNALKDKIQSLKIVEENEGLHPRLSWKKSLNFPDS